MPTSVVDLHSQLIHFLGYGLYPVWLASGAVDYLCHRRTSIHKTSGSTESWLHVIQFVLLVGPLAAALLFRMNAIIYFIVVAFVIAHTIVAYVDIRYTQPRRFISPLEQLAHAFMDMIPLIAVALLGILHWEAIRAALTTPYFQVVDPGPRSWLLLASFILLSGVPILEELIRTKRAEVRAHIGLATMR